MSPEGSRTFEKEWPALASRLDGFLARKGIGHDQREDLVQETGARLVGMWHSVDRNRPTWALTLTIALNILRDRYRRGEPEIASELPDIAAHYDLEQAGIARIELGRVKTALASLTDAQRAAVLAEIGYRDGMHRPDSSADKMMRSRARRRLNSIVGRASVGLTLQFRRAGELIQAMAGSGGSGLQGIGCAACALLAFGSVVGPSGVPSLAVPFQSGTQITAPSVTLDQTQLELRGVVSRALGSNNEARDAARARRSSRAKAPAVAKHRAPKQARPSAVPAPLSDPPQPPNLGRGTPKPPGHPVIERVKNLLAEVNPKL